jgi:multidrug resistance protein, MATE family
MFRIIAEEKIKNLINKINLMAIPLLGSHIIGIFFNIGDQALIGRTTVESYAGVGIAGNIIYFLTGTIGILAVAFNILALPYFTKKDYQKFGVYFNNTVTFNLLLCFGFMFLSFLFLKPFLSYFYDLKGEVLKSAVEYGNIASAGLGINALIFTYSAFFKNINKTKINLIAIIISGPINILIDYVLIFGKFGFPKLGPKGAAIGTVVGLLAYLLVFIIGFSKYKIHKFKLQLNFSILKKIMKIYIPLFGQDLMEDTIFFMAVMAIISRLTAESIATYNVLLILISFFLIPVYAYSGSSMILVSQAKEKNDLVEIKNIPIVSSLFGLIFLFLFGFIFIIFPELIGKIITDKKELIYKSSSILIFVLVIQVFNITNQIYKSCLQGLRFEKWVMVNNFVVSIVGLMVIYFFTSLLSNKLLGIYFGFGIYYFLLTILYLWKYSNFLKVCFDKKL